VGLHSSVCASGGHCTRDRCEMRLAVVARRTGSLVQGHVWPWQTGQGGSWGKARKIIGAGAGMGILLAVITLGTGVCARSTWVKVCIWS
jgi:hypothetical protein